MFFVHISDCFFQAIVFSNINLNDIGLVAFPRCIFSRSFWHGDCAPLSGKGLQCVRAGQFKLISEIESQRVIAYQIVVVCLKW